VNEPPALESLAVRVRRVQQADERFRRLRVQVDSGTVTLRGVVARWQDLHELSRAVARVPGVERVILRDIRTSPGR
jgi:osmotically-inducible protein OsmY